MDEQPKIVKRRRARSIESITDSNRANESSVQPNEPALSVELADQEQFFESIAPHSPAESWSAIDRKPSPSYYATVSQWEDELREIRQEGDRDIWESCPYD